MVESSAGTVSAFELFSAAIAVIGFFVILWKVPQWQIGAAELERKDRLDLEIKARSTLAQIVVGSLFLLTAYSTWNSIQMSREELRVSREGQITERFAAAVELLGSDGDDGQVLPKRMGGIYALERIAQESPRDYWPIMEVLTGFLRTRSPRDLRRESEEVVAGIFGGNRGLSNRPSDVQAVLSVLQRRSFHFGKGERFPLDLSVTDLSETYLYNTNLEGAFLFAANLSYAFLTGSNFKGANLAYAKLDEASLEGANFEGALLDNATMKGARYDSSTRWPEGFNPQTLGAIDKGKGSKPEAAN